MRNGIRYRYALIINKLALLLALIVAAALFTSFLLLSNSNLFAADQSILRESTLSQMFQWLGQHYLLITTYVIPVVFFIFYLLMLRRFSPTKSLLKFNDLSSDKESADHALVDELILEIHSISAGGLSSNNMGDLLTLERNGLVSGQSDLDQNATLGEILEDSSFTLGPLKFSTKKLISALERISLMGRTRTFIGGLKVEGNDAFMWASVSVPTHINDSPSSEPNQSTQSSQSTQPKRWFQSFRQSPEIIRASAQGDCARKKVIRQIAAQIALIMAKEKATNNWESLLYFADARDLIRQSQNTNDSRLDVQVIHLLRESVRLDPANWIARFQYGMMLMKHQEYREASDQFHLLSRLIEASKKHLRNKSTERLDVLHFITSYNQLVASTQQQLISANSGMLKSTIQDIDQLRVQLAKKADREENTFKAISYLADSAYATALTTAIDLKNNLVQGSASFDAQVNLKKIKQIESDLWNQTKFVVGPNISVLFQAHAITQNALGRAFYLTGRWRDSLRYLEWANKINSFPDYIDPKLNLASLYLKQKSRLSPRWTQHAIELINEVLSCVPDHTKAHYLKGKILASDTMKKYDEAKAEFEHNRYSTASQLQLAILLDTKLGRSIDALRVLQESFMTDDGVDQRSIYYVTIVNKLYPDDNITIEQLELVTDRIERVKESNLNELIEKIKQLESEYMGLTRQIAAPIANTIEPEVSTTDIIQTVTTAIESTEDNPEVIAPISSDIAMTEIPNKKRRKSIRPVCEDKPQHKRKRSRQSKTLNTDTAASLSIADTDELKETNTAVEPLEIAATQVLDSDMFDVATPTLSNRKISNLETSGSETPNRETATLEDFLDEVLR